MGMIFNFFATRDEVIEIWDWIRQLEGIRLLETYSRPDLGCREFEKFPTEEWGADLTHLSIGAWPSQVGGAPKTRYVEFDQPTVRETGANGLTVMESPAFIGIHPLDPPTGDLIGPNELFFWTEKLARNSQRFEVQQLDSVDWQLLQKTIGSIKQHVRKMAVEKWRTFPVSAGVDRLLKETPAKLWFWGVVGTTKM